MFDGLARAISAYRPSRPSPGWCFVGLASSFPNIDSDLYGGALAEAVIQPSCAGAAGSTAAPISACKVLRVPQLPTGYSGEPAAEAIPLAEAAEDGADLQNQVLVFQYRGKIHAVDHVSIFSSFFFFFPVSPLFASCSHVIM